MRRGAQQMSAGMKRTRQHAPRGAPAPWRPPSASPHVRARAPARRRPRALARMPHILPQPSDPTPRLDPLPPPPPAPRGPQADPRGAPAPAYGEPCPRPRPRPRARAPRTPSSAAPARPRPRPAAAHQFRNRLNPPPRFARRPLGLEPGSHRARRAAGRRRAPPGKAPRPRGRRRRRAPRLACPDPVADRVTPLPRRGARPRGAARSGQRHISFPAAPPRHCPIATDALRPRAPALPRRRPCAAALYTPAALHSRAPRPGAPSHSTGFVAPRSTGAPTTTTAARCATRHTTAATKRLFTARAPPSLV
jgi:hypothetical protein